ncbi:Tuberin [Rhizoctonia solani]|uniref:Tuberin n=1 Tax=Rhizoctonia solani TaxID=456999 RepID=A0A8H8P8G6_9AGAM|nr:Tuberin [Rhizoctonia solani]QRW25733.1 Tuberin [Rhizoctonia solani]
MDYCNDFFALALMLNVARNCPPRRSLFHTPNSDLNLIEELWQDTYQLLQKQGSAFWESTIAEHAKSLARELIYRASRYQIVFLLGSRSGRTDWLSVSASTISRIEVLAGNKKLTDPKLWDEAWNSAWKKNWNNAWKEFGPTTQLRNSGRIQAVTGIAGGTTISMNGRAHSRVVGRIPIKLVLSQSSSDMVNAILGRDDNSHSSFARDEGEVPHPPGANTPPSFARDRESSYGPIYRSAIEPLISNTFRPSNQVANPYINHIHAVSKLSRGVSWIGSSCVLSGSGAHEIWATPQESAIEAAWTVAWPEGERLGREAATSVESVTSNPRSSQSGAKPRRHTMHPSVVGVILATKAVAHLAIRTTRLVHTVVDRDQQVLSNSASNIPSSTTLREQVPRELDRTSHMVNSPIRESPRFGKSVPVLLSSTPSKTLVSGSSSGEMDPTALNTGLRSISEVSSQVHLPTTSKAAPNMSPVTISGVMSEPFAIPEPEQATVGHTRNSYPSTRPSSSATTRQRSESARRVLRRHVIPRLSDAQRNSQLEDAFVGKTKEKTYQEKKDNARQTASNKAELNRQLAHEQLSKVDPTKQAEQAWEQMMSVSGTDQFRQNLNVLAKQEWDKVTEKCRKAPFLAPVTCSSRWEESYAENWAKTWKGTWGAAWETCWDQAFKEAIVRGIEFGVEDALDSALGLKRRTYEQLRSGESYSKLKDVLGSKSPPEILEQVYQWMRELAYLSESLNHIIPTLRDDCMEIMVFKKFKTRAIVTFVTNLGVTETEPTPTRMSHFELQTWLTKEYIPWRVDNDDQILNVFLQGIAEVWDLVSELS